MFILPPDSFAMSWGQGCMVLAHLRQQQVEQFAAAVTSYSPSKKGKMSFAYLGSDVRYLSLS
jgi:hypothetical protein